MQPDLHTTAWHPRKTSIWRQLLGACGGVETRTRGQKTSHKELLSTKRGDVNVLLTASAGSNDSSRSTVDQTIAAASVTHTSVCNKSDQLPEKMLVTSILESGGEQQSSPGLGALSSGSSYVGTQALCVSIAANRHATVQIESPDYSSIAPVDVSLVPKRDTTADDSTSLGRLHVALSANSIRDIAQCDPTMRIRHLRPLSYSPGTVVYKGTWQGLLIAVKFMLYRGGDAQGVQRRVSSLLASHCMPQRSQLARVYACDMSEVVYGVSPPAAAVAAAAEPPTTSRRPLTVRPLSLDDLDGDDGNLLLSARSSEVHDTADGIHQAGPSSPCEAGRGRCGASSRGVSQFHFSSVVFSDPSDVVTVAAEAFTNDTGPASINSASVAPGPSLTIQGLLDHLGAQPGDYLLHCVSELASGGNLWHGIRSGTYDMYGPLGPLGAARSVVHTARGIAQGLHQLHTAGEVHGGLSPRNVVLLWSNARGELVDDGAGAWRDSQESPGLYSGRGFTARVADCGMRRLVLGGDWRSRLEENPELRMCTAPELLKLVPAAEAGDVRVAAANAEIEWLPHHDVFSFGALLYCMCTGHHRDDPEAASAIWPDHAWDPLRNLSDVCMAPDPSARPTSREIVSALLVLEQRLHYAGGGLTRCLRVPASRRCGSTARRTAKVAMSPPKSAVTARRDGSGATTYEEADIVDAAAVFLHATAEEEATKKAGTGLEQTAPAAGRALLCTQFHPKHRQTFALSSMPEVLLLHPCGDSRLEAPHVIF
ncbi:hypothetical protein Vretimale_10823 [Volvox reticuliferus]|uniref:Protein kinase domain-containing protein n=1 Tax=Volvox reticuliferus TaxID=1737510 RepID=A0A8J4GGA9_9CHLO|nr:hypothetical protein Vretifemale_13769 [Volvox reticuliferus]GIM06524.1 hypothetical protein Vretimale_10823 [Volvox reticuliferus]